MFDLDKPWRFVGQGRSLNSQWPLRGFAEEDSEGTVYMQIGLKGGGPVKLKNSEQVSDDGNLNNLAEFEKASFTAELGHVLLKMVDHRGTISWCDITNFLDLEAKAEEGYYVIKGRFQTLRQRLEMLRETGIEKALTECGWMITCHFFSIYDPIRADIILFRKPLATAVSAEFVRAVLRSSLARIGTPRPVKASDSSVLTKIKLWGTTIFHDRKTHMQDFIHIWEQSSTVVCDMVPIRLAGPKGYINPDYPLRYYTRCIENNQTVATFNFMVGPWRGVCRQSSEQCTGLQHSAAQCFGHLSHFSGSRHTAMCEIHRRKVHGAGPGVHRTSQWKHSRFSRGLLQRRRNGLLPNPEVIIKRNRDRSHVGRTGTALIAKGGIY